MKKNLLIAAGGSGGHMLPALVFHDHLKKNFNISISSDLRGLKYINCKKYNLITVKTPQIFKNKILLPTKIIIILWLTIKSIFLIKNKKIDLIISMGGYAPTPLCLAGFLLNKKLYLYEPNLVIGNANKFFLLVCKKIFCHSKNLKKFPNKYKKKICEISPIVRKMFYHNKIKKNKKFIIMIVGGSQGAKLFDNLFHKIFFKLSKKINLRIIHQTKLSNIKFLKNFYSKNNISNKVFNFDKSFYQLIRKCNFCITRAGASTLAELFILKIPFLAIPLMNSKDNHQYENAKYYQAKKSAWILDEKKINQNNLYAILKKIIFKKTFYEKRKKKLIKLNANIDWNTQNKIMISALNEN